MRLADFIGRVLNWTGVDGQRHRGTITAIFDSAERGGHISAVVLSGYSHYQVMSLEFIAAL